MVAFDHCDLGLGIREIDTYNCTCRPKYDAFERAFWFHSVYFSVRVEDEEKVEIEGNGAGVSTSLWSRVSILLSASFSIKPVPPLVVPFTMFTHFHSKVRMTMRLVPNSPQGLCP